MNKETIEEAAEKEYGESKSNLAFDLDKIMYKCYMSGADFGVKWMEGQMETLKDFYVWNEWKNKPENK